MLVKNRLALYREMIRLFRGAKRMVPLSRLCLTIAPRKPASRIFGWDRGLPVDRYYIEDFLAKNASVIKGEVLEVADSYYTDKFGGQAVTKKHVLHLTGEQGTVDIIGNLETGEGIPESFCDCFIMTQTFHLTYDLRSVIQNSLKILKPGGTWLVTMPGISQISRYDMEHWGDYWRFTDLSIQRILSEFVSLECFHINVYGNVKSAASLLYGLTVKELSKKDLDYYDEDYQVIIAVAVKKPFAARKRKAHG